MIKVSRDATEPEQDAAPEPAWRAGHTEAVATLERELGERGRRRLKSVALALLLLTAAGAAVVTYRKRTAPTPPSPFVTAAVETRDIAETVESNGKLRPLVEVKVGTQVSGRVVRVYADFNRPVKQGDLLAEIDPSLFAAQVGQVSGQVNNAEAQLERARAAEQAARVNVNRSRQLRAEMLTSQAELERTESELQLATADIAAASAQLKGLKAQLASAGTTLAYTKIYSPIDGIVIDRAVDPGQTVASSFAAPVLFVIARDLSAMQALADIDEADVGKVREGMPAAVRVDAFQDETFAGTVTQIRYNPTEAQGVVTYAAVIDVKNDELKLRPGMTATVTIKTQAVKGVSAVRNAALRFKPKDPASVGAPIELGPGQRRLFLPGPPDPNPEAKPKLNAKLVRVGISDGVFTELKDSTLTPGTKVVTEERSAKNERGKFLGVF